MYKIYFQLKPFKRFDLSAKVCLCESYRYACKIQVIVGIDLSIRYRSRDSHFLISKPITFRSSNTFTFISFYILNFRFQF